MMEKSFSKQTMETAFRALDAELERPLTLILGGGGAMILAHQFPLATSDVDAIAKGMDLEELNELVKKVAKKLDLPADWLNAHFATFAYVLLPDAQETSIKVFSGKHLQVQALSAEDMLIMKCFAHRPKDVAHAKALLRKGVDLPKVESRIEALKQKGIVEASKAFDFLDEILEQME